MSRQSGSGRQDRREACRKWEIWNPRLSTLLSRISFSGEPDENFTSETSFLEEGIIDSTGILELVTFLEETYEIQIEGEGLVPENLDSINNVVQFLK